MKFIYFGLILGAILSTGKMVSQTKVQAAITHVPCSGSSSGIVKLTPIGTGTPYTYSWTTGATTNIITNKVFGNYTANVINSSNVTTKLAFNIGYKVKWQNLSGLTTSSNGDTLIHANDGVNDWGKMADGANVLAASTDGWVEYVVTNVTYLKLFGLLDAGSGTASSNVDFAFTLNAGGALNKTENGVLTSLGSYAIGDILRIERLGTNVLYKKNSVVLATTPISGLIVASTLTIRAALYTALGRFENMGCSFAGIALNVNAGADVSVLANSNVTLGGSPTASGGSGNYTYNWTTAAVYTPNNAASNPSIVIGSATTYFLTVTDNTLGCTKTDDIAVSLSDPYFCVPRKTLDGGYYNSYNQRIYVSFEEEYFDAAQVLTYAIVNDNNTAISSLPAQIEKIGDNRYSINLASLGLVSGKFYRIIITNKKNEMVYARFKY